jgi:hypothetical protein
VKLKPKNMALLKRQSFIRDTGNDNEVDYQIYLLKYRPLDAHESKKDRDVAIEKLKKFKKEFFCELYEFGRKNKPCDKQCEACKCMQLDKFITKT